MTVIVHSEISPYLKSPHWSGLTSTQEVISLNGYKWTNYFTIQTNWPQTDGVHTQTYKLRTVPATLGKQQHSKDKYLLVWAGSVITNWRKPKSCLGRVFNSKLGRIATLGSKCMVCMQPLLKLKTRPRAHPVSQSWSMVLVWFLSSLCRISIRLIFRRTCKLSYRPAHCSTDLQTVRQSCRLSDRPADCETGPHTVWQTCRLSNRPAHCLTDLQTVRQARRLSDRPTDCLIDPETVRLSDGPADCPYIRSYMTFA